MNLKTFCKIIGAETKLPSFKISNFCFNERYIENNSVYFAIVTAGFKGYNFDYKNA